jgi:hypothetical protein
MGHCPLRAREPEEPVQGLLNGRRPSPAPLAKQETSPKRGALRAASSIPGRAPINSVGSSERGGGRKPQSQGLGFACLLPDAVAAAAAAVASGGSSSRAGE